MQTVNEPSDEHSDYDKHLWRERWKLVHRVWLSALYHAKRERYYETCDKLVKAFAAIGGAAAVAQLLIDPNAKLWVAAAISVLTILSLVYSPVQKAKLHGELSREFKRLWASIEEAGPFPPEEALGQFRAKVLLLEGGEPASYGALVKRCENEISASRGQSDDIVPLRWNERLLMHLYDFNQATRPAK